MLYKINWNYCNIKWFLSLRILSHFWRLSAFASQPKCPKQLHVGHTKKKKKDEKINDLLLQLLYVYKCVYMARVEVPVSGVSQEKSHLTVWE